MGTNPHISQVFLCDVAQALLPAASALLPTLGFDAASQLGTRVERSLVSTRQAGVPAPHRMPECGKCGPSKLHPVVQIVR